MEIKIKYSEIHATCDFLYNLKLKGLSSVHRTRLCKILNEKINELVEEQKVLIAVYVKRDKDGNYLKDAEGNHLIQDNKVNEFKVEQDKFLAEELIINGTNNKKMLETIKKIILTYDDEISGAVGDAFANLYEQLEGDQ